MAKQTPPQDRLPLSEAETSKIQAEIADQRARQQKDNGCGPWGLGVMMVCFTCPVFVAPAPFFEKVILAFGPGTCACIIWAFSVYSARRDYTKRIERLEEVIRTGYAVVKNYSPMQFAVVRDTEAKRAYWLLDLGDDGSVLMSPRRKKHCGSHLTFRDIYFRKDTLYDSATTNEGARIPCVGKFKVEDAEETTELELDMRSPDRFEDVLQRLRKQASPTDDAPTA